MCPALQAADGPKEQQEEGIKMRRWTQTPANPILAAPALPSPLLTPQHSLHFGAGLWKQIFHMFSKHLLMA